MSSGLFTTSNLLIGAGALVVAAVGGGVLYTSIKKPPANEKAILADAAFEKSMRMRRTQTEYQVRTLSLL